MNMNMRIETPAYGIALAVFAAFVLTATAVGFPERGICGHGCDLGACPEDSVVGLRSAIAKGAHMVEFDVQRCKTGELVVIHDGKLDNKTTVTGIVSKSSFDYIRSARLRSRKYPNEKVPTLDEMLDALPREGMLVNVHCYGDELVGRDAALKIKEKGRIDQAYIACWLPMIKKAREAVPEIRVCNMTRPDPEPPRPWTDSEYRDYIKASAENNCQYIQLRYRCTKEIADEAHKAGLKINYCPRNCEGRFPERLEEILAFGADYVFCENLTPVLRKWRELTGEPAKGSPIDELMPVPRSVERHDGVLDAAAAVWSKAKVTNGAVPGAPSSVADEAYVLEITPSGVAVTASAKPGLRNARTTLEQLAKLSMGAPIPCCRIVDWPELRWRGFMLDTGRNYLDVPSLKDLIDVMAEYKLNLYHWHITEYYGWRLESKRYPQVAERGYYDPLGHRHRGKFYTQEEFKEIVDYAFERGVTVMPEFDVPGHAEAFRNAFGFKSMKDPAVKETLCNLIDELCSLVPAEKMPFVHLGGDEVWDEKEKIEEESMTAWAATVAKNGRTLVTWDPGQSFKPSGPRVAMLWGGTLDKEAPWFDARGWYIEDYDPFEVLGASAYRPPFQGKKGEPQQLGAIFCGWHDSAVGLPYEKTFREQPVFPSCVLFGDLYWRGRDTYRKEFVRRRLPLAGDPLLDVARDLERRAVAQRDKVLLGLRHPFHFVRQTQMRWRMTELDGTVVAKDIAQGAVFVYDGKKYPGNVYHSPTGTVVVETWVKSPNARTIGAWIGFSAYDRDHGRSRSRGTPDLGKWNKFGATISVNGEQIPPPVWQQPSLTPGKTLAEVGHVHEIDETPYTNDEWYMREPTPVQLKKGWNHVRMVLPMTRAVDNWHTHRWVGIFMPVDGTTDHPHEVDDLEYSSDPPDEAGEFVVWTADSMRRVSPLTFPDESERRGPPAVEIAMARNERESAQICITCGSARSLTDVRVELSPLVSEASGAETLAGDWKWERVGYVPRMPKSEPHPFGLPKTERWLPDPLLPAAPFCVKPGRTQGVWLTVYAASGAKPGAYAGTAHIVSADGEEATVKVRVTVSTRTLPKTFSTCNAVAMSDTFLRKLYPDRFEAMHRAGQDMMLDHRLSPDNFYRSEPPRIDDLLHARARGMNHFCVMNVPYDVPNGVSEDASAADILEAYRQYYPKFLAKVKPCVEELRRRGLDKMAYFYGFDERGKNFYPAQEFFWKSLARDVPGIPFLTTSRSYEDVAKGVTNILPAAKGADWFCPEVCMWNEKLSKEWQRDGKKMWWYVCCGPHHPYANFASLEAPPMDARILGWMTRFHGVDGFLYWAATYWANKTNVPLDESDVYLDWDSSIDHNKNGDGVLIYPGKEHLLPSIRLANLRDGVEDGELLKMLYARDRAAADAACRRFLNTTTNFKRDVALIRESRADLLKE